MLIAPLVAVKVFVAGSKSSALASVVALLELPPVIKTFPLARRVAACTARAVAIEAVRSVKEFVAGSKSSALERKVVSL